MQLSLTKLGDEIINLKFSTTVLQVLYSLPLPSKSALTHHNNKNELLS